MAYYDYKNSTSPSSMWEEWGESLYNTDDSSPLATRRSLHAVPFTLNNTDYIIYTGGFTDTDWFTFPIYLVELNYSNKSSIWYDLTPANSIRGRIGHISAVTDEGLLVIFGGLLYEEQAFYTDEGLCVYEYNITEALITGVPAHIIKQTNFTLNGGVDKPPLPRGMTSGGMYDNNLLFIGGLYSERTANGYEIDEPLNDVWRYNISARSFELLPSGPPARIAHATAVSDNKLIVYGGMANVGGVQQWETLADVWTLDLVNGNWTNLVATPSLPRAYHSLVAYNNNLVAYGGYRASITFSGEPVAYVFSDVLVASLANSRIDWYKANLVEGPSFKFDHTAVMVNSGYMMTWGGRFREVRDVSGLWGLNVSNPVLLNLDPARSDEVEFYQQELKSLNFLILVLLFGVMLFTAVYSTVRWRVAQTGGNQGLLGRSAGLSTEEIEALPLKTYTNTNNNNTRENNNSDDDEECCAICLLNYEEGDELRSMPCGHEFHKECVDEWLTSHRSCPHCRHELASSSSSVSVGTDNNIRGGVTGRILRVVQDRIRELHNSRERLLIRRPRIVTNNANTQDDAYNIMEPPPDPHDDLQLEIVSVGVSANQQQQHSIV